MAEIEVRDATAHDLSSIAALRWMEDAPDGQSGSAAFVTEFVRWAGEHPDHHCVIALDGRAVVGMAWLAVLPRVPGVGTLHRAAGDIQTVFLLPEYRNQGTGTRMLARIGALARELGLMRVTVHSGTRAIPLYERAGFASFPQLMAREEEAQPNSRSQPAM
jgi:GNAT superfamily N-acetyltransferase